MANKKTKEEILVEAIIEWETENIKKHKSEDLELAKDFLTIIRKTD